MNPCPGCRTATPDRRALPDTRQPPSRWRILRWRRGGELAGWIIPSLTLVFLPKCPICVAAYVALFSGIGLSLAGAATLRTTVLILCTATLLCLALKRVCRWVSKPKN